VRLWLKNGLFANDNDDDDDGEDKFIAVLICQEFKVISCSHVLHQQHMRKNIQLIYRRYEENASQDREDIFNRNN
jgi:hypothetical protein